MKIWRALKFTPSSQEVTGMMLRWCFPYCNVPKLMWVTRQVIVVFRYPVNDEDRVPYFRGIHMEALFFLESTSDNPMGYNPL